MSDVTRSIKHLIYKITEKNSYLIPYIQSKNANEFEIFSPIIDTLNYYLSNSFNCRKYHELHLKKKKERLGKADEKANSTLP